MTTNSAPHIGKDYIGVGVGAVLLDQKKHVLLLLRKKEPEAGFWCLPGGKVELFETRAEAVLRETCEEVGLTCKLIREVGSFEHILKDPPVHWVTTIFLLKNPLEQQPINREPEKHAGMKWFSLTELPDRLALPARFALDALLQDPSFFSPSDRLAS